MSLYKNYQTHMNITESRKHAVKLMTKNKGMKFYRDGEKMPKCKIIDYIKRGFFDGWFYRVDYKTGITLLVCFQQNDYIHKIGN